MSSVYTTQYTVMKNELIPLAEVLFISHWCGGFQGHVGDSRHVDLPSHMQLKRGLELRLVEARKSHPGVDWLMKGTHYMPGEEGKINRFLKSKLETNN